MKEKIYNRPNAVEYAVKWSNSRNPRYYNYENLGGDCTNFISQCIYAGCGVMNYNSWYYNSGNDKAPAWTGVEFLYNFLVNNKSIGPSAFEIDQTKIQIGDIIQLSENGKKFTHSLFVIEIQNPLYLSGVKIATHSYDALYRPVSTYSFQKIRFLHINDIVKF